jgi:hypothetical protein
MKSKELQQYIKEALEAGETKERVVQKLLHAGWGQETVGQALEDMQQHTSAPTQQKKKRGHITTYTIAMLLVLVVVLAGGVVYLWNERIDLSNHNAQEVRNFYAQLSRAEVSFTDSGQMVFPDEQRFISEKEELIAQKKNFVEVDLRAMNIVLYKEGIEIFKAPVLTKGKEGSWWETPTGKYEVLSTFTNKFSSIGNVWMPYSIQFYGNYFIHGWPYYSNGTPVPEGYSGGCIRLSDKDAKKVFDFVQQGTVVLVLEQEDVDRAGVLKNNSQATPFPGTTAESAYVSDMASGNVLIEKNPQEKIVSRSAELLLSAIVAHEVVYLARPVVAGLAAYPEEDFISKKGESYIGMDVLYPLLMQSSNNAQQLLMSYVGEKIFLQNMRNKAGSLGMSSTSIEDINGNMVVTTTAQDIAKLLTYTYYKRPFLLDISKGIVVGSVGFISVGDTIDLHALKNHNIVSDDDEDVVGYIQNEEEGQGDVLGVVEIGGSGESVPVVMVMLGGRATADNTTIVLRWLRESYE